MLTIDARGDEARTGWPVDGVLQVAAPRPRLRQLFQSGRQRPGHAFVLQDNDQNSSASLLHSFLPVPHSFNCGTKIMRSNSLPFIADAVNGNDQHHY